MAAPEPPPAARAEAPEPPAAMVCPGQVADSEEGHVARGHSVASMPSLDPVDSDGPCGMSSGSRQGKSPRPSMARVVAPDRICLTRMKTEKLIRDNMKVYEFSDCDILSLSVKDRLAYHLENMASVNEDYPFYVFCVVFFLIISVLGSLWMASIPDVGGPDKKSQDWFDAFFYILQVAAVGEANEDMNTSQVGSLVVYIVSLLLGLLLVAVLIGMVTARVDDLLRVAKTGRTRVADTSHTLILGWNETTVRVVCQIALLRAQVRKHSRFASCILRRCGCTRRYTSSPTPVGEARIVILAASKSKMEMHKLIEEAFEERGISRATACVGRDVVCRVGDPASVPDLRLVGADRAKAILVQMTEEDEKTAEEHEGVVVNSMTLRTMLALRVVLSTAKSVPWEDLRVVAQLSAPSTAMQFMDFGHTAEGRPILHVEDLTLFLNRLMFRCCAQPGLAQVTVSLLGFQGKAIRLMRAEDFQAIGHEVIGKTAKELALFWEDAIFAGVIGEGWRDAATLDHWQGFAPAPDRVIHGSDRIIYVCDRPLPRLSSFKRASAVHPDFDAQPMSPCNMLSRPIKKRILVCGWRAEWDNPSRWGLRMFETAEGLPDGSSITFLCTKDVAFVNGAFDILAAESDRIGQSDAAEPLRRNASPGCPLERAAPKCRLSHLRRLSTVAAGQPSDIEKIENMVLKIDGKVRVHFIHGDPASYEVLGDVFAKTKYDSVIVLSTNADAKDRKISPLSRDTRMLNIMLFIHHLQAQTNGTHIIGENALDSSAVLANTPMFHDAVDQEHPQPDMVNVQAIYARALVQNLAFPRLQSSMAQLFSGAPGAPSLRLEPAAKFLPPGEYSFGAVVLLLQEHFPGDILIGIRGANGQVSIAPGLTELCKCDIGDLLVLITRRLSSGQRRASIHLPEMETHSVATPNSCTSIGVDAVHDLRRGDVPS